MFLYLESFPFVSCFFFSSIRRHTRLQGDWISDVCSSDLVAWGLRVLGMKDDLDGRVERALQQAALWDEVKDRLKKGAFGLSGGQQQRLCIARAIAVEPEVVLLDEPASALDPIATSKIEDLIRQLSSDYTIVIVTHNMQQASRVSDVTAFFYMGQLIEF